MLKSFIRGRVSVFIDAANLESSTKDLEWHIDYCKLRDLFGCPTSEQLRYYCVRHGTENQDSFFAFLKRSGYKLVTKPLKVITDATDSAKRKIRKANFDVEIALDALELAEQFDTLVLCSGDSDFHVLVQFLHKRGKRVIVISTRYHVARELVEACDKYVDLRHLRSLIERKR